MILEVTFDIFLEKTASVYSGRQECRPYNNEGFVGTHFCVSADTMQL